jgi:hypothetical protein
VPAAPIAVDPAIRPDAPPSRQPEAKVETPSFEPSPAQSPPPTHDRTRARRERAIGLDGLGASEPAPVVPRPPTETRAELRAEGRVEPPPASPGEGSIRLTLEDEPTPQRETQAPTPRSSGVRAGSADDNLQYNAFLEFVAQRDRAARQRLADRVLVKVRDRDGLPVANAHLVVKKNDTRLAERTTYADGRTYLYPSESAAMAGAQIEVSYGGAHRELTLLPSSRHDLQIDLDVPRRAYGRVPLDLAFVLDTTGSMGDEIADLKQTIEAIHFQITHLSPQPDVRFGMVLYRDKGDDYRTQVHPFTADLLRFRSDLDEVEAGGGGDYPEDVQAALEDALHRLDWRTEGSRLMFLIGDAPPHEDYGQDYTYRSAMSEAARRGIKIAAVGASGLDPRGEFVWRRLAQYTMGPFVFLTYGEEGDSEGGTPSSVSHHVGTNWSAENLDAIVVRLVKIELAHYGARPVAVRPDYFDAVRQSGISSDAALRDLFRQSTRQLIDYSVEPIDDKTPTTVLPIAAKSPGLQPVAAKLDTRLALGLAGNRPFRIVEQEKLPELLRTMAAQFSENFDQTKIAEVGKLVPARLAVIGKLDRGGPGRLELLVKLVRLETGEVLSLSLLKIDEALLL